MRRDPSRQPRAGIPRLASQMPGWSSRRRQNRPFGCYADSYKARRDWRQIGGYSRSFSGSTELLRLCAALGSWATARHGFD